MNYKYELYVSIMNTKSSVNKQWKTQSPLNRSPACSLTSSVGHASGKAASQAWSRVQKIFPTQFKLATCCSSRGESLFGGILDCLTNQPGACAQSSCLLPENENTSGVKQDNCLIANTFIKHAEQSRSDAERALWNRSAFVFSFLAHAKENSPNPLCYRIYYQNPPSIL